MKTEQELETKIKTMITEELKTRLLSGLARKHTNCIHNYKRALDDRKEINGQPNPEFNMLSSKHHLPVVGLCMYGSDDVENWPGTICDDDEMSNGCRLFENKNTRESITEELQRQIKTPGWLEENWNGLGMLLWALDSSKSSVSLTIWQRIKNWCKNKFNARPRLSSNSGN